MKSLRIIIPFLVIIFIISASVLIYKNSLSASVEAKQYSLNYIDYTPLSYNQAQQEGRTVLYFFAPWCGTCTNLDNSISSRGQELPQDVTILKIDYDSAGDLKKKYGITLQHTLVQVDHKGEALHTWVGIEFDELKKKLSQRS